MEHIIQDAASDDGTAAWLAAQDDCVWRSEPDGGMYDAIARAWARARGEFLSWLNADEQYLPGTLAVVQRYFDANPGVDVVFGDYIVTDASGRPVALRREIPFRPIYVANTFLNAQSCTLFLRRHLLDAGQLAFDPSFRYAADADLMLRLARRGARIRHTPRYLALFGIDGTNLSTHSAVTAEAGAIRKRYGAYRLRALRAAVFASRRLERLLRGAYRREDVHYLYAIDEVPTYIEIAAAGVGGRYHLDEIAR